MHSVYESGSNKKLQSCTYRLTFDETESVCYMKQKETTHCLRSSFKRLSFIWVQFIKSSLFVGTVLKRPLRWIYYQSKLQKNNRHKTISFQNTRSKWYDRSNWTCFLISNCSIRRLKEKKVKILENWSVQHFLKVRL